MVVERSSMAMVVVEMAAIKVREISRKSLVTIVARRVTMLETAGICPPITSLLPMSESLERLKLAEVVESLEVAEASLAMVVARNITLFHYQVGC